MKLLLSTITLLFILSSCASTQTNEEYGTSQEIFKKLDDLFLD